MQANTERQQQEKEKLRKRHRAKSDAAESEFPASPEDILTETFDDVIEVEGIRFNTVKLFHPKPASMDRPCMEHLIKLKSPSSDISPLDPLGIVYKADPICDDVNLTLPLEVHALTFESAYYSSTQGKKKLRQIEAELQRLCRVKHRNVCRVYAVRLLFPLAGPPRLSILMEERPTLTLFELLEDSGTLRLERAMVRLVNIVQDSLFIQFHRTIPNRLCGALVRYTVPTYFIEVFTFLSKLCISNLGRHYSPHHWTRL